MKKNKKVPLSKKPFIVLSRRAVAGWVGVIFLLCAWMFVIGLLVGRGTAPVTFDIDGLQTKLEFPGQEFKSEQKVVAGADSGIVKDKTKLDFYEALPEDRDDTKIDPQKPVRVVRPKAEAPPAKKPSKTTAQTALKKAAPPKGGGEKSASVKKAATKAPPPKPFAAKGEDRKPSVRVYTVQVASLKAAEDADRLVAQLKKKGHPAYRTIAKVQGKGIWFRVRVGRYKSKAEARAMKDKLVKNGMKPIIVVK